MAASKSRSGVEVLAPFRQSVPVVFASPHSGKDYSEPFVRSSRLSPRQLRRSEDSFIDEIFAASPEFGAPLLRAHFPRAYVDPNRSAFELDPAMFTGPLPAYVTTVSPRIVAGLGTVPRVVANGEEIYHRKLEFDEIRQRIERHYVPYHQALVDLRDQTLSRFGIALVIDCHSMPSTGDGGRSRFAPGLADIVLGDCHGRSCHRHITDVAERICRDLGLSVARNKPYAGGYTTKHYGKPRTGVHALQIEINRSLYMDEVRIERGPGLATLTRQMRRFINAMTGIDFEALMGPSVRAAE
ncbi:MAG: N-formylglutamate amidohydrolase [Rhodospirillales bacterium]|nr:N-formylglutamate amidohydrolase [Rhodospirillales bacterium]